MLQEPFAATSARSNTTPSISVVSPDRLGPEHIRRYQALMFSKWKLAPNTVSQRLAALRFFYIQVLKQNSGV